MLSTSTRSTTNEHFEFTLCQWTKYLSFSQYFLLDKSTAKVNKFQTCAPPQWLWFPCVEKLLNRLAYYILLFDLNFLISHFKHLKIFGWFWVCVRKYFVLSPRPPPPVEYLLYLFRYFRISNEWITFHNLSELYKTKESRVAFALINPSRVLTSEYMSSYITYVYPTYINADIWMREQNFVFAHFYFCSVRTRSSNRGTYSIIYTV